MVLATSFYDLCTILIICSTCVFFSSKKTGKCKHESCPLCASCNNFYRPICFIIRSRLKIWFHKYFFVKSNPEPYLCIAWVSWITTTAVKFLRNKSLNISFSFHVVLQKISSNGFIECLETKKNHKFTILIYKNENFRKSSYKRSYKNYNYSLWRGPWAGDFIDFECSTKPNNNHSIKVNTIYRLRNYLHITNTSFSFVTTWI